MPAPPIAGLHHIKVPVSSLERSLHFYTTIIGARHITEYDHLDTAGMLYGVILSLSPSSPSPPSGGSPTAAPPITIELRHDPDQAAKMRGFNLLTFAVETGKDVESWAAWCTEQKVENSGKLRGLMGYLLAMEDPDGMHVRVYSLEEAEGGKDPKLVSHDAKWV